MIHAIMSLCQITENSSNMRYLQYSKCVTLGMAVMTFTLKE